jgi:hypothetical protein
MSDAIELRRVTKSFATTPRMITHIVLQDEREIEVPGSLERPAETW